MMYLDSEQKHAHMTPSYSRYQGLEGDLFLLFSN
uniref:Uncharacterized protein n=1 Tax=Arundo donax TaxID=35708 RepID=A0A0A9M8D5_ARUDO